MLRLVSKDSVKNSDHFDVLCVLVACMVLEIINQMSKNPKSSLIVWNTVLPFCLLPFRLLITTQCHSPTHAKCDQNNVKQLKIAVQVYVVKGIVQKRSKSKFKWQHEQKFP